MNFSISQWLASRSAPRQALRLVDRGIAAEKSGDPTTALDYFRQAVAADDRCASGHMNLGVALQAAGEHPAAIASYERAIAVDPEYTAAHYNLARAHWLQSQHVEAEAAFRTALRLRDDFPEAWVGLAGALEELGRNEEALSALDKALALRGDYVGALLNSIALLRKMKRVEAAVTKARGFLELEPENPAAHTMLGLILQAFGEPSEAESSYRNALAFDPDYTEAKSHLSSLLQTAGRNQEAVPLLFDLVAGDPTSSAFRASLAQALDGRSLTNPGARERAILLSLCLDDDLFAPLHASITALLKGDEGFQTLQRCARAGEDPFVCLAPAVAAWLREPILLAALPRLRISDVEVEEVLTHVRRCILLRFTSDHGSEVVGVALPPGFVCALAQQCFFSGYAFFPDENERQHVARLHNALEDELRNETIVPSRAFESSLAVAALYESLHSLKGCERLLEPAPGDWGEAFRPLLREQLENLMREREIAAQITPITTIDDAISLAVRAQYEENPYPRWVTTERRSTDTVEELLARLRPGHEVRVRARPVPILIAGCGTGSHPIAVARSYPDSDILAVDLSLSSLAYASRMSAKLGVTNISYRQADILKLGELAARFTVIECAGVLHHLDDPLEGWRVLIGLLEPDGVMRIALYSQKARRGIQAARELAQARKFPPTTEGIQRFRRAILSLPDDHPAKRVLVCGDFFATDPCRDLVMHVREHQFTLPRIAEHLDQLGLEFLGLECANETRDRFEELFPSPDARVSIAAWHQFEEAYPDTFLAMYVFWCCRK